MPEKRDPPSGRKAVGHDPLADLGEIAGVLRRMRTDERGTPAEDRAERPAGSASRPVSGGGTVRMVDANGAPPARPGPARSRRQDPKPPRARETGPRWPSTALWRRPQRRRGASEEPLSGPASGRRGEISEAPEPSRIQPELRFTDIERLTPESEAALGEEAQPETAASEASAGGTAAAGPAEDQRTLDSLYEEAKRHAAAGRHGEAVDLYLEILRRDPRHVRARNNLGLAYDCRGDFDLAVNEYLQALELEPRNVQVHCNLGAAYGERGWYDKAEEVLKQALRLDPKSSEVHCNLGIVYCKKGMYHLATMELKRALELEANYVQAHYYLGECYNHLDRLDDAIAAFERALEGQPQNPKAYYNLGILFDKKSMPERAQAMYRRSHDLQGGAI